MCVCVCVGVGVCSVCVSQRERECVCMCALRVVCFWVEGVEKGMFHILIQVENLTVFFCFFWLPKFMTFTGILSPVYQMSRSDTIQKNSTLTICISFWRVKFQEARKRKTIWTALSSPFNQLQFPPIHPPTKTFLESFLKPFFLLGNSYSELYVMVQILECVRKLSLCNWDQNLWIFWIFIPSFII